MHTTKLATECMWKAHFRPRRMHPKTFQNNHLTLTYGIFLVNRNINPEISEILSHEFLTFHLTLVINYANQASFERIWVFLIVLFFLHAYWIVSDGPSGHLKQSSRKTLFEQRSTSTCWRALKSKKVVRNGSNIVVTSML